MNNAIRVYDAQFELLAEVDLYNSLQITLRYHDIGEFELVINQHSIHAEHFQKGHIVLLNGSDTKGGIIHSRNVALDSTGKASENWSIRGRTFQGIMSQRITEPPAHTSHDRKSGPAETVMKHYVRNNFITHPNPDRILPQLFIEQDERRGAHVEWESRFQTVSDELMAISTQTDLGWTVKADVVNRRFIFAIVEGRDLTQGNAAGHDPVSFSPDYGTVKTQNFVDSDQALRNVAYVGGPGEGIERVVMKIGEASGLERFETFVDARDISDDPEEENQLPIPQRLQERGEQKLQEMQSLFSFEAEIMTPVKNHSPFIYERDYGLGDRVDVDNRKWGVSMEPRITEVKEIHEPAGFALEATFGPAQPTFIKKIREKFAELDNADKQEAAAKAASAQLAQANEFTTEQIAAEQEARNLQVTDTIAEAVRQSGVKVTEKIGTLSTVDGVGLLDGMPVFMKADTALWSGFTLMSAAHTVTPSKKITDCPHGWMLVWSAFANGAVVQSDWNTTFIPKTLGSANGGAVWQKMNGAGGAEVRKLLYPSDVDIVGSDVNNTAPHSGMVLRSVFAY